jgi:hypothetical protein
MIPSMGHPPRIVRAAAGGKAASACARALKVAAIAGLSLAIPGCLSQDAPARSAPEQYVVFMEADYALGTGADACSREKFERASKTLAELSDLLFARSITASEAGDVPSVEFYALNENVTPLGTLEKGKLDSLRTDYDITRASRRFHEGLLARYEQLLRERKGTDLNDVVNSVTFLKGKRDAWLPGTSDASLTVIYVDDLVHYNTNQSTNAESGQFNFANSYSLERFQRNIQQGFLWDPKRNRLADIAGETSFEVFSILFPRCADEPWSQDAAPNFEQLYPPVNQVWRSVFNALGADEVALGLTSTSTLSSRLRPANVR